MADKDDSGVISDNNERDEEATEATEATETTETTETNLTLTKIPRISITCDERFLELNCMVDKGGTKNGCHTETFGSYKTLLKHNLENHRGLKYRCQFCLMFFNCEKDKINHEDILYDSYHMNQN